MRLSHFLLAWTLLAGPAKTSPAGPAYRPTPFDNLGSHLASSVVGWPLGLHLAAAGSTWLLLEGGVDAAGLRVASRQDPLWSGLATAPGLLASSFAPFILPPSLYFLSEKGRATGAVAIQSVGVGFLCNNVLKAVTGRVPPDSDHGDADRLAEVLRFGFLRGGLFDGWPSGHAMTSTTLAMALASYHRDVPWPCPRGPSTAPTWASAWCSGRGATSTG